MMLARFMYRAIICQMATKRGKVQGLRLTPVNIILLISVVVVGVLLYILGFGQGKKTGVSETETKIKSQSVTIAIPDSYTVGQGWNMASATCYPLMGNGSCSQQIIAGTTKMLTDFIAKNPPRTIVKSAPLQFHSTNCNVYGNSVNCFGY